MNPEANRSDFLVSRFAGCLDMDSRNSSDPKGTSVELASAREAETLAGQSIFDEPDFLASMVLGFSEATGAGRHADAGGSEATSDLERQRLLRQATEISKRLKHQQQELDRREANLQAATAALQGEQRAWRLQVSQEREDLAEHRKGLVADAASLSLKANELAAWEASVIDEVNTRQNVLDSKGEEIERQQARLSDQHRRLHHQQHELEESQAAFAQDVAAREQQHQAQVQGVSADRRTLREEKDQWAVEQENWKQLKHRIELFFRNQPWTIQPREQGAKQRPADSTEVADRSMAVAAARVHRHGQEFEQELVRMQVALEKFVTETLKPIEQQSFTTDATAEVSKNVSQLCRQIRGMLKASETTFNALRAENQAWSSQVECRLRELATEERGIVQSVRTQLEQIRGQWLQLDSAHELTAPHFLRQSSHRETTPDVQVMSDGSSSS
jgi:DNA repair exonuclease SbcCD ATPase subunit